MIATLQRIAYEWGVRCFGIDHMTNTRVRALRHAEEAIELAQSLDVEKDKMLLLVEQVYSRPTGDPHQEMGGCMVTLSVLCETFRPLDESLRPLSLEDLFETEVRRCLSKTPEHFARRNLEKIATGLD